MLRKVVFRRLGSLLLTAAMTTGAATAVVGGSLLAFPSAAWAGTCAGTSVNLVHGFSGTACFVTSGSTLNITITPDADAIGVVFICYAETNVDSQFNSPSQCAGGGAASFFTAEATPSGGQQYSPPVNPANLTLSIVGSNPSPNGMQVDPGDYVYLHVGCSGTCANGATGLSATGYQVPPNAMTPDSRLAVLFPVLGAAVIGGGFWFRRRRVSRRISS